MAPVAPPQRATRVSKPTRRKRKRKYDRRAWTKAEDAEILRMVTEHGTKPVR